MTGFSDGEGCFHVEVIPNSSVKVGYLVSAVFSISLHSKDVNILRQIKSYFNEVGSLSVNSKINKCFYRVKSIDEIVNNIIPHFDKYPLKSRKNADYVLWKNIANIINLKGHLNNHGFQEILNNKATLNRGLNEKLSKAFPFSQPVPRPSVPEITNFDPYWIAGFTTGEGCFRIRTYKNSKRTLGHTISLQFILTQHSIDSQLISRVKDYLGCGHFRVYSENRPACEMRVNDIKSIVDIIIPLFQEYHILGVKALDFADFCKAAEIVKTGAHNSQEGSDQILAIKVGMNKGRLDPSHQISAEPCIEESGSFYVYNHNHTVLYYQTTNLSELTEDLEIKRYNLLRCLDKGTVYYTKFTFSRSLIPEAKHHLISLGELKALMLNVRLKRNK